MADYTIPGIIGIVAIVLIFAVVNTDVAQQPQLQEPGVQQTLVGSAYETGQASSACEPRRYCDGSRLVLVQQDCSQNTAYCKYGCADARCLS